MSNQVKKTRIWDNFQYVKFGLGKCLQVPFWLNLWCWDTILKDAFPILYCIAGNKETFVVANMIWNAGVLHWDFLYVRPVNDWEVGIF